MSSLTEKDSASLNRNSDSLTSGSNDHGSKLNIHVSNSTGGVEHGTELVPDTEKLSHEESLVDQSTTELEGKAASKKELDTSIYEYYKGKRLTLVTLSLMLVLFLASLDIIITATIIEKVAERFGSYGKTGWLVTGYALPTGVMVLIISQIAMSLGVKFTLLVCVLIFEIGSLISGLANSMNMLIAGRVIAGIGGAGIQNLVFIIVSYIVEEKNRGLIISFVGIAFSIASIAGPFLGGAFTTMHHQPNWRMCFYINLPIGGVAFIIFYFLFNHKGSEFKYDIKKFNPRIFGHASFYKKIFIGALFQYDFIEFAICTTGLVLFLVGLTYGGDGTYHWHSAPVIVMTVIGGLLVITAFLWDCFLFDKFCAKFNQKGTPLINILVFKKFGLVAVNLVNFLMSIAYITQMLFIIQFFQFVYGNSAWKAAVHLLSTLIAVTITVVACGVFIKKTGQIKLTVITATAIAVIGAGLLQILGPHSNNSAKIGLLILPGIGFGGIVQSTMIGSQVFADKTKPDFKFQITSITSFYSFAKLIAMAFGSIIANVIFDVSVFDKVQNSQTLTSLKSMDVNELIVYRLSHYDGTDSALGKIFNDSTHNVFWLSLGLSAFSFICSLGMSNKKTDH
ncbi:hypothetical protein ACO0RG_000998 [Hanseniaspora osmophila]